MYDFTRCKLCAGDAGPLFDLGKNVVFACSRCDFHYVNALDGERDGGEARTLDSKARSYMEDRLHPPGVLDARIDFLRRYCDPTTVRCLDIGAGVGQFLRRLSVEGGEGYGIEPSRLRRDFARSRFGLDLRGEEVDAPYWQENFRGFFDVATLWDVIEHVDFPRRTMEATRDLLKPGGILIVDTPSRDALSYRLSHWSYRMSGGRVSLFLPNFYPPVPFGHKQIFRRAQLVRMLEESGLSVIPPERKSSPLAAGERILLACRKPSSA